MPNKPSDFPKFESLDSADMRKKYSSFCDGLKSIAEKLDISYDKLYVSKQILYEIIERVEKRRVYFHIFHNGMEMGELNECSLYCFWFLKLCPFHYEGAKNDEINQVLAFYIFISIVSWIAQQREKTFTLTKEKCSNLYYAFRYRDLSKEAIMALAESFVY
ncbi:MAG: hypothetical protein LBC87_08350 [Fibromonadaceae bacterium]|jgi:hypothetical protein|nr:hypothetical protein [Fibromonadaceae bacterium]